MYTCMVCGNKSKTPGQSSRSNLSCKNTIGQEKAIFTFNAIPQPYDQNGFPSKYATQSNAVEIGNNVILPSEQICGQ
ncbi:unnamed protein product [Macrosiphum euphorbiae]|uniref:Uncharacterized protein n=1 Tax=Macrosiphum euphorbiae TaxID=13131 RepID=A0AAV0Y857_9HEMI|nr:unnamed protein product [Macrosiphum euphorbiae]